MKHLGAALEFVGAQRLFARAHAVAHDLGEDHDLAVLARRARRERAFDPSLRDAWARRRARLQKRALKRARRLYRAQPKAFVARLARARAAGR